ncbi:MAG: DNA polymerase domain-containing protein [Polyangiales bacterium]
MPSERERSEWLWGWDETPGIVSVWAETDGRATVWRRPPESGRLVREESRFRPWLLLDDLGDLQHLGDRLRPEARGGEPGLVTYEELDGPGRLRFLVRAHDGRRLAAELLRGAAARTGRYVRSLRELGEARVFSLPPEEQYLVATGRTHFRGLRFDDLVRTQIDLETTGLDPERDRIFLVAIGLPDGTAETLEAARLDDEGEAELLRRLAGRIAAIDPDVIENHNLHGFDLPFLARRARLLGVALRLDRLGGTGFRQRPAARGSNLGRGDEEAVRELPRRARFTLPGRELVDTLDAVRRYDFAARDLPGHGLDDVARHLGLSGDDREAIPGHRIHAVYLVDADRVRRYAKADVREAAGISRMLGGSAFALARMAPRRYERLADAGPATGVLDPMLVRAYLRSRAALPTHDPGDGTTHTGAALHLFACGVAQRIVKADVASLYPSLMRQYAIGPSRDRLGAFLSIVDRLVDLRLDAKARAKKAPPGSAERHTHEAMSAAMKIVVNSAYGYLGAVGLTRFSDVHAANEVTRRGRETLDRLCRELDARGVTLLEADTDGVYFAVPRSFTEADERRVVDEVDALLPELVSLELDGRYAAMLSHEPKNYALLGYDGTLLLRGVAFRSRRAERYGEVFLERALGCLLRDDVEGVREAYVASVTALRRRALPTFDVTAHVRLTKTPAQYASAGKRELPYEALLANGVTRWPSGTRIRVYRASGGRAGLLRPLPDAETEDAFEDPRDYDVEHYVRLLRQTFAARLARALAPDVFDAVFADPKQLDLFVPSLREARPILTIVARPRAPST